MERPLERVDVGPCRCPGEPHERDWVDLIPEATIPIGTAVYAAVREAGSDVILMQGHLARIYVSLGIRAWSFVDEAGEPLPIESGRSSWGDTVERLLPWGNGGMQVADAADRLYSDAILRPLMSPSSTRSPGGRTDGRTSATRPTGPRRQKRSGPSLPGDSAGMPSAVPES